MKTNRGAFGALALGILFSALLPGQFGTFGGMGMGVNQRQMEPQRLQLRPWVMANAMYWDNLAVVQDNTDQVRSGDIYGGMLGWGLSGGKSLERSAIALSYNGNARYTSSRDGLGAISNVGTFAYYKQFSKEWSTSTSVYGGASAGAFGTAGGFGALGSMGFNGFGMMSVFSPRGIGDFVDPPPTEGPRMRSSTTSSTSAASGRR